ncbi:MAG: ABC transporter permease [Candidatus Altiarchaeota archaeon]|nr:ABC transporter permease [Candidatus Altiarchaeota archaeon]
MFDIALKNVFRQKTRSGLTILSIAMGIGLILALGSIGEGLNRQLSASFGDIAGVIDVRYSGSDSDEGITEDMIADIEDIPNVESVIPVGEYRITRSMRGFSSPMGMVMITGGPGGGGGGSNGVSLTFTALYPEDQDYLIGEGIIAEEGRKLDDSDSGAYVVLLGSSTAENQLLNIGDEIEYERREDDETESFYFEVIGILEETGDDDVDVAAYVPITTMQEIEDDTAISSLKVKITDVAYVENVTDDINDYEDMRAMSPLSMVRSLQSTLSTIQMAVFGIAAVSLIVGGIGITNTMVMSVMERRREIGIMKAIGATTNSILVQVLQESAVLSGVGGLAGLGLGYLSTMIITDYTSFSTVMTPELVAIGLGFSLILGMGAGIYPAWSASRLDPIQVLKYE